MPSTTNLVRAFESSSSKKSQNLKAINCGTLESDDDGEEQMNMETFLKRKDLKGHWDATGVQNKKFILVLSSSQLIIMQPASDNKWAKIKARR